MLSTKVIASSISNLTDARYFAAWGVEAMGFDLQLVSVMQVNAFKEWISGPKIIGQFSGVQDQEGIQDVANHLELDIIQLDPLANQEWRFSQPILREVMIESFTSAGSDEIIIKSGNPNFSISDHRDELTDLCSQYDCYLDLNIDIEELEIILDHIQPKGLVLRGGDEEKVGFKSFDELDEIMEALEED